MDDRGKEIGSDGKMKHTLSFAFDKVLKVGTCAPYKLTRREQKTIEKRDATQRYMKRRDLLPLHGFLRDRHVSGSARCFCLFNSINWIHRIDVLSLTLPEDECSYLA